MATKTSKKTSHAKTSTQQPRLTLHQLLGAVSFWGSATRLLLVAFMVAVIFVLKLNYLETTLTWEVRVFIYIFGTIALLDIGYVIVARSLPLRRRLDLGVLLACESFLTLTYLLPNLIYVPTLARLSNWIIFIVLLTLGVRALLGILFTTSKK